MPLVSIRNEMSAESRLGKPMATSYVLKSHGGDFCAGAMPSQFFDGYEYKTQATTAHARSVDWIHMCFQKHATNATDGAQKPVAEPLFLHYACSDAEGSQTISVVLVCSIADRAPVLSLIHMIYFGNFRGCSWTGAYEFKGEAEEMRKLHRENTPKEVFEHLRRPCWVHVSDFTITLSQSPADVELEHKLARSIEVARLKEKTEKLALERFGPDLHDDLKQAKFDKNRFNVAVVGTNNCGKSTLLNRILLMDDGDRFTRFKEQIRAIVENDESGEESGVQASANKDRHVALEQVEQLKEFFEAEGRATTWDMVREGRSHRDLDAFFTNCTFWDLPGIEAADGGVDGYGKHVTLNQFDLVFLVADRQLLEDDFHLILRLQKAAVDGRYKPSGVPFFIIRTKMDLKITGDFKKAERAIDWNFRWFSIAESTKKEMLDALMEANEKLQMIDESYRLENTGIPDENFFFSGDVEAMRCILPFQQLSKTVSLFEGEISHCRKVIEKFAREKSETIGAARPIPCINNLIREAMLELPHFLDHLGVQPAEYVKVCYAPPSDGKLGFGVKKTGDGLVVVAPSKGDPPAKGGPDLRESIGLDDFDVIVEFPTKTQVTPAMKAANLCEIAKKVKPGGELAFVVLRTTSNDQPRTFATSRFKAEYEKRHEKPNLTEDREEYETNVANIVKEYTTTKFINPIRVQGYLKRLTRCRDEAVPLKEPLHKAATCDWTSQIVLANNHRPGASEFCSMVNDVFRSDGPAVIYASIFFDNLRDAIVTVPKGRRGPEAAPLAPRTKELPGDMMTYRGTCMPRPALKFFLEKHKLYRAPFPIASSSKRDIALEFADRSQKNDPQFFKAVMFHIDNSERPLHVDYVQCQVEGEDEYLYAPYSCFEVLSWNLEGNRTVINIKAFHDNRQNPNDETRDSEEWPLAMWH